MAADRIPLAWKNLVHQPRRLLVAVGGIGFAVVLIFMQLGFRNALFDSTVALHQLLNADLVVSSAARYTVSVKETFSRRRLTQALGCAGRCQRVAAVYREFPVDLEEPAHWAGASDPRVGLRSPQSGAGFPEFEDEAEALAAPHTLLVDRRSKGDYSVPEVGSDIELSGHQTKIVGTFDLGTDFANDGNVIISDQLYRAYFTPPGSRSDISAALTWAC